jgi:hypothetical protein
MIDPRVEPVEPAPHTPEARAEHIVVTVLGRRLDGSPVDEVMRDT